MSAGGKAIPAIFSAEDGESIVKVALNGFGGVHALVVNAGILWDKSFTTMGEKEWDNIIAVLVLGFASLSFKSWLCVCVCGVEADLVWCKWYNSELGAQTAMLPSLSPKE